MNRLILLSLAVVALTACSDKKENAANGGALDNLSAETAPPNDASALEAVEAENARSIAIQMSNETELDENSDTNAASNQTSNAE